MARRGKETPTISRASPRRPGVKALIIKALATNLTALLILPLVSAATMFDGAQARKSHGYIERHYTSRFNPNRSVTVLIRSDRFGGREVRLPTGRWVGCGPSCRWTVEKKYLDILEYQNHPFGPGFVRFRF